MDATKTRAEARLHELAAKDRAIPDVNTIVVAAGEECVDELVVTVVPCH